MPILMCCWIPTGRRIGGAKGRKMAKGGKPPRMNRGVSEAAEALLGMGIGEMMDDDDSLVGHIPYFTTFVIVVMVLFRPIPEAGSPTLLAKPPALRLIHHLNDHDENDPKYQVVMFPARTAAASSLSMQLIESENIRYAHSLNVHNDIIGFGKVFVECAPYCLPCRVQAKNHTSLQKDPVWDL